MRIPKASKKKEQQESKHIVVLDRKRLLTNSAPFAVKEAYVKLRTNLMFCVTSDGEPCRVFMITSGAPSEGKSLTAANTAISLAMLGKRTLLIDMDMRKPNQQHLWGYRESAGLCNYLAGIGALGETHVEGLPLSVIFTGTIPPNPSELLSLNRTKRFLEICREKYDYVILDTPPINTVADAQIMAAQVDGTILVARAGTTTTDELAEAMDSVQRSEGNLCGVVLDDTDIRSSRYSYRYRYGYRYGYRYEDEYGYRYGYSSNQAQDRQPKNERTNR